MTNANQTLYDLIYVSADASQAEIENACLQLGERYQPDNHSGDLRWALKFAQVENAYETLHDPVKRAAYDAELLWQGQQAVAAKDASGQHISEISPHVSSITTGKQSLAGGLAPSQQQAIETIPNLKARYIAIVTTIAILLASAFPPFQITVYNRVINLGYSFVFSPPHQPSSSLVSGSVNLGMLFTEYVLILAIGALAWLFSTSIPPAWKAGATSSAQSAYAKWRRVKVRAGAVVFVVLIIAAGAIGKAVVRSVFHPASNVARYTSSAKPNVFDELGLPRPDAPNVGEFMPPRAASEYRQDQTPTTSLTFPGGQKYVGGFKDGKMNGQGKYTEPDGTSYVGEFRDGKYNGLGTYTWANGRKHVGAFKDGARSGQGMEFSADGTILLSGIWENDVFVRSR